MTVIFGVGILLVGVLVTLGSIFAVSRWVPDYVKGQASDSWAIFAFCGVLYALVVGFVISFALTGYQESRTTVGDEGQAITGLSRVANLFDADSRDRIGHELICYSRAVVVDEWPRMSEGQRSQLATAAIDRLIRTVGSVGSTREVSNSDAALGYALARVGTLSDTRAVRLGASKNSLPPIFWLFMIGGGLILCLYAAVLAGREPFLAQFIYILPVALLLLSSIYMVATFERPFAGPGSIEPTAIESALRSVTEFIPDPRADRPCP